MDKMWDAYFIGRYQFSVKAPDEHTAKQRAESLLTGVTVKLSTDPNLPLVPVWPQRYTVNWK